MQPDPAHDMLISRRRYLIGKVALPSVSRWGSVSATVVAHPHWDMDAVRPWSAWERELAQL